jgi:hypothetical protein
MKVAICLSGFIRTWEYSKVSFIKNLLQDLDCDIFIHTYKQNYYEYSSHKKDVIYTEDEIKQMFDGLNVKSIVIEDRDVVKEQIESESKKYEDITNYKIRIKESSDEADNYVNLGIRIYDQLRKINLCNQLRKDYQVKNNVKYDLIVKSRFDVLYIDKINWSLFTEENIAYNGTDGCGGFPDDLVAIGKEKPMNAYMDRFLNLDKMCFSVVNKNEINYINWYNHHNDTVFPIKEFCAHDTLLRNLIYNGCDIKEGGFRNRLIRNENQILNWKHCNINGIEVQPIKMTNGVVLPGDNSPFDVKKFNNTL